MCQLNLIDTKVNFCINDKLNGNWRIANLANTKCDLFAFVSAFIWTTCAALRTCVKQKINRIFLAEVGIRLCVSHSVSVPSFFSWLRLNARMYVRTLDFFRGKRFDWAGR